MNENRKSNSTSRAKFHRCSKKEKFDPNRFYWCYGKGDIPVDMEFQRKDFSRSHHD